MAFTSLKLPYSGLVYSDGCGSMRHVEIAAVTMGLQHAYLPPHERSLNEAEKICLVTWDDAAALMLQADGSSLVLSLCGYAHVYHSFSWFQNAAGNHSWYRAKLRRFYTCSFVYIPRQKRKQLARKVFIGRAEVGRLMGFQSPFSTTYRVLLSGSRIVHNRNVTFDDI